MSASDTGTHFPKETWCNRFSGMVLPKGGLVWIALQSGAAGWQVYWQVYMLRCPQITSFAETEIKAFKWMGFIIIFAPAVFKITLVP